MSVPRRVALRVRHAGGLVRTPPGRRELRRQYTFEALRRVVPVVGVRTANGLVFVSTADRTIGRSVYVHGQWDPDGLSTALMVAARHGHDGLAGRTFLEVGANIGTTTLQAAAVASRCIAVEPDPDNLELLRANVTTNGLADKVTVVGAAVTAYAGSTRLSRSEKNHGDHRVSEAGEIEVECVTLDDVVDRWEVTDIGLLWLDTQGHEAQVLAGATKLLAAPPVAVTEYWPPVLRERGDLDRLHQALKAWSGVIDLQRPEDGLVSLDVLAQRYEHGSSDLLLLP